MEKIDFTKVWFITYATDEYLSDIPIYDVVNAYASLQKVSDETYTGEFENKNGLHKVTVNISTNKCYVNYDLYNAEQFLALFIEESLITETIKTLTGVDLDDYISQLDYEDGKTVYLDVKGRTKLKGDWKRKTIGNWNKMLECKQ